MRRVVLCFALLLITAAAAGAQTPVIGPTMTDDGVTLSIARNVAIGTPLPAPEGAPAGHINAKAIYVDGSPVGGDAVDPTTVKSSGTRTENAITVYDAAGKLVASGCRVVAGVLSCGDGTAQSAVVLPELLANGTNDTRIYGAASQTADGCIVWPTGNPTTGQILRTTSSTATIDEKTCTVMEWATPATGGELPYWYNPRAYSGTPTAWGPGSANEQRLIGLLIDTTVRCSYLDFYTHTPDGGGGLYDIGIYSGTAGGTGTLVAHCGPTTLVGSGALQTCAIVGGEKVIPFGKYWAAMTGTAIVGRFGILPGQTFNFQTNAGLTGQTSTDGNLKATITLPADNISKGANQIMLGCH